MPDLALLTKHTKNKNKSDAPFDAEVFHYKDNTKTVFVSKRNIGEWNKKLY